jgi:hypothetical protein
MTHNEQVLPVVGRAEKLPFGIEVTLFIQRLKIYS